ncbi:unnamed protein product [Parnassius apollo]|uniref:(apollo) hypothetical protein n=1 Tax=Parnassius apollo TaxID=110799 RepID=A0A8S3XQ62_PARAO|nr:unnamed protein product [Parnassius apollo]
MKSSIGAKNTNKESDTTSEEDTDTNENHYADTDDDYLNFDDELTMREIETEVLNETNQNNEVKVLSEVRFTPENEAYFN